MPATLTCPHALQTQKVVPGRAVGLTVQTLFVGGVSGRLLVCGSISQAAPEFPLSALLLDLGAQFLLGRQVKLIAGGEDLSVVFGQGVANDRIVFVGAKQNADRRVLIVGGQFAGVVVD